MELIRRAGLSVRDVLRQKGTPYDALGLDDPSLTDDQLLDAMMAHPILINRPDRGHRSGREALPPVRSRARLLAPPQRGVFTKEDGERVVDEQGRRVR